MHCGAKEGLIYSLSRWTDLPAAKWQWFVERLAQGWMYAIDPRTGIPAPWSLVPVDTLGMVFWTRHGSSLVRDAKLLRPYKKAVHFTLTGWTEVEHRAPDIAQGLELLRGLVGEFGADSVTWRFSPVPLVADVLPRFARIAEGAAALGLTKVYLSFLQDNDLVPEHRSPSYRRDLLTSMARETGLKILLCNEDRETIGGYDVGVRSGVCEDGRVFSGAPQLERCGCALAVDPFTRNEACVYGCSYCLDPETPVLHSDLVWRPISDVKVGDILLGFDEEVPGYRLNRKIRETVVEAVWCSDKPTVVFETDSGRVTTTAEHRWLAGATRRWKPTSLFDLRTDVFRLDDVTPDLPFTEDYKIGYLAGITWGDGTLRYEPDQARKDQPQPYWRVALADEEPLKRMKTFLASFGVQVQVRPFDAGRNAYTATPKPMQKVEVRAMEPLRVIHALIKKTPGTVEFQRGFLAGIFDAEGSHNQSLRVHQQQDGKDHLFQWLKRASFNLGFDFYVEGSGTSMRLRGDTRDRIRFFSRVRPALLRKMADIVGHTLECVRDPIRAVEKGKVRTVIDIQTSTRTFFAAGLATHNCYAADSSGAPKKRNTTLTTLRRAK